MDNERGLHTSDWVRFEDYEVRDGFIRPVPGSAMHRYSPSSVYAASREKWRQGKRAPYEQALEILETEPFEPIVDPRVILTAEQLHEQLRGLTPPSFDGPLRKQFTDALIRWCREYGLLGIALRRYTRIELMPRWMGAPPSVPLWPVRKVYLKTAGFWRERWESWSDDDVPAEALRSLPYDSLNSGDLVDRSLWCSPLAEPRAFPASEYASRRPASTEVTTGYLPLGESWGVYFPGVPRDQRDSYSYPLPLTDEFWRTYAEPVEEFWDTLIQLHMAASPIVGASDRWASLHATRVETAIGGVYAVLSPGQTPSPHFTSDSLLTELWFELYQDLTAKGGRMAFCANCGKLFFTNAYQQDYCSSTCTGTANKSRLRQDQALARDMYARGMSATEIAERLSVGRYKPKDPKTVEGWMRPAAKGKKKGGHV